MNSKNIKKKLKIDIVINILLLLLVVLSFNIWGATWVSWVLLVVLALNLVTVLFLKRLVNKANKKG